VIVNWLSDPLNTLGLVTSTSISSGKKRIWKSVISLWNALPPRQKKLGKIKGDIREALVTLLNENRIKGKWAKNYIPTTGV